jgi:hypothetical protein
MTERQVFSHIHSVTQKGERQKKWFLQPIVRKNKKYHIK